MNTLQDFELAQIETLDPSRFKLERKLGEGGNGQVFLYSYQEANGDNVKRAVKFLNPKYIDNFNKEVLPLLRLGEGQRENIVQLIGKVYFANQLGIVLEYLDGGDLSHVIHETSNYNLKNILDWMIQSSKALEHMHSYERIIGEKPRKYVHRDVKPANLVLASDGKTLKLCDFGLSKMLLSRNTKKRGTPLYMAPEVSTKKVYNEKCDVYSWTLTFWECLTRETPFGECVNEKTLQVAKKREDQVGYVTNASEKFNQIIKCCSSKNSEHRLPMKCLRKLLENMITIPKTDSKEGEVLPDKQTLVNDNICLWKVETNEFYYCNGLNFEHWEDIQNNIPALEIALNSLPDRN